MNEKTKERTQEYFNQGEFPEVSGLDEKVIDIMYRLLREGHEDYVKMTYDRMTRYWAMN